MILKEQQEIIKNIVKDFFNKATIAVEIKEEKVEGESFKVNIETESPQLLIGENGQTLSEIQYLLRLILRKKIGSDILFDLDINDYKSKKASYLKELANIMADEVVLTKQDTELLPMLSQDRRIIHLALSDRTDVVTESLGQGTERRVVIKLRPADRSEITMPEE
ncbi:KH domain-containing protein [Patescibacteria group bacterium]|nr:KH domain-containing protein [Patescibacteria group bacterium]MBU4466660.1 KH domain-containing protein [Patescibacteria group bacterium]